MQIVQYVEDILMKEKNFDRAYCVFDRDVHREYHNAIFKAQSMDRKYKNDRKVPILVEPIYSNPCFELWILSHFKKVGGHLERDEALRQVKEFIPGYDKGMVGVFKLTSERLISHAYPNAEQMRKRCSENNLENPLTQVDRLVKILLELPPQAPQKGTP